MADTTFMQWEAPTCSANTAVSAYTTTSVSFPQQSIVLESIEIRIPAGHQGLTGIALIDSGSFVIPWAQPGPAWLIGDNDLLRYDYGLELGTTVSLATYNTDSTYNHGWQVRLVYTPYGLASGPSVVTVPGTLDEVLALIQAGES